MRPALVTLTVLFLMASCSEESRVVLANRTGEAMELRLPGTVVSLAPGATSRALPLSDVTGEMTLSVDDCTVELGPVDWNAPLDASERGTPGLSGAEPRRFLIAVGPDQTLHLFQLARSEVEVTAWGFPMSPDAPC